jgi:hypothetical protein
MQEISLAAPFTFPPIKDLQQAHRRKTNAPPAGSASASFSGVLGRVQACDAKAELAVRCLACDSGSP